MSGAGTTIRQRLRSLEEHLKKEAPELVGAVDGFRQLDEVGRSIGLLDSEQSFATQISWWPMISVLGTFSAGKSTFINHFLGTVLQETGNQAVDDKFTVICFGGDHPSQSLPGLALDADPRFPFYRISNELEKVASGEGRRVDTYLQLKTSRSANLRGRILIDSPGFDADSQRTATLRLTDHIIDLSDLVLVFFDARHPEPGAMRDTLSHLVGETIKRPDATKFVYILNQMDTTAREDNPEAVVGAWQRALAQEGLTAGRFYTIYNPDVAVPIPDAALRSRYESKRDHDLGEIHARIQRVGVERAYRITGSLEKIARDIEDQIIPELSKLLATWRRLILRGDVAIGMVLLAAGFLLGGFFGLTVGSRWFPAVTLVALMLFLFLHFRVREFVSRHVINRLAKMHKPGIERDRLGAAFQANTRIWLGIFRRRPAGWSARNRKKLHEVIARANRHIQELNDRFTDPSGVQREQAPSQSSGDTQQTTRTEGPETDDT